MLKLIMSKEISLTGKNIGVKTIVDVRDFRKFGNKHWRLTGKGYVHMNLNHKTVYLHRLIMNCPPNKQVDHINGNKLDNRRRNLRICNNSQNNARKTVMFGKKSSKYKGVYNFNGKPYFSLQANNITISGRGFKTEFQAHIEYEKIRKFYFGEYV